MGGGHVGMVLGHWRFPKTTLQQLYHLFIKRELFVALAIKYKASFRRII